MNLKAIAIGSKDCSDCSELKSRLTEDFLKCGYFLDWEMYDISENYYQAMEAVTQYGLIDIPSVNISGVVFRSIYGANQIKKAIANSGKE